MPPNRESSARYAHTPARRLPGVLKAVILLAAVALVLRAAGAAVRVGEHRLPLRILGWALCATAAWTAASTLNTNPGRAWQRGVE